MSENEIPKVEEKKEELINKMVEIAIDAMKTIPEEVKVESISQVIPEELPIVVEYDNSDTQPLTVGTPDPIPSILDQVITTTINTNDTIPLPEMFLEKPKEIIIEEPKIIPIKLEREIVSVDPDVNKETITFKLDNGFTITLTKTQIETWLESIWGKNLMNTPLPETEKECIEQLLQMIWAVRKRRVLTPEAIDKALAANNKQLQETRAKLLSLGSSKEDIHKIHMYEGVIKSLTAENTNITSRRHLVRMTYMEEGDLRGQLAKIQNAPKSGISKSDIT